MLDLQLIDRLGDLCGVASGYLDWDGTPVDIDSQNKIPLLAAMGFDLTSNETLSKAIADTELEQWQAALAPVVVVHQGAMFTFELRCLQSKRPLHIF